MTLEQREIDLMNENTALRRNDRALILEVWDREGLRLTPEQKEQFLHRVSSPESIRRTRQKIQEKGICMPDATTYRKRHEKAAMVRETVRADKSPMTQAAMFENRVDPWQL